MANDAIWILGGTGRIGRAVAALLVDEGFSPVLVGRDAARLGSIAEKLGGGTTIKVAGSLAAMVELVASEHPGVVLNTVGPFTNTAVPIARACPRGTHYVDLSNELPAVQAILALQDHAVSAGSTFVTGAGFGVLATESVVLKLCQNRPPAMRVRCAAIPGVAVEPGPLGEAFAASLTEGFALGGRQYDGGKLVRSALLGDFERIPLPDGRMVGTASAPSGELEAARRASGAAFAISATSMVPSALILRAALPPLFAIMKIAAVRRFATRRIAAIEVKAAAKVPQVSWSYARVEWSSGETRQGWTRTGDAMVFTAEVMARVAIRLTQGAGSPGAYTPGVLFGPELAGECGGEISIDAGEA
jgi:short subunit dehydrogenase-like uncharacterized protein